MSAIVNHFYSSLTYDIMLVSENNVMDTYTPCYTSKYESK